MIIKEVEALVGITKKNIRFYERMGLLNPDRNRENSYRNYSAADVERLKLIKLLRSLYLPIDEIRRILAGATTAAESLQGHAAQLTREIESLGVARSLCAEIAQTGGALDVDGYLARLQKHEKEGVRFMNIKKRDSLRAYVAPVLCAVVMVGIMAALIGLFMWGMAQEDHPPAAIAALIIAVPAAVAVGTLIALVQRIREINRGETDEARKY